VYSGTTEYRYAVTGVRVADSEDEQDNQIPLLSDNKYLNPGNVRFVCGKEQPLYCDRQLRGRLYQLTF